MTQSVNAPLPENAGSKMFRDATETKILPRVDSFAPDLIVISAGFDAHRFDPIGGLRLKPQRVSFEQRDR